jgi:hypothetical protein
LLSKELKLIPIKALFLAVQQGVELCFQDLDQIRMFASEANSHLYYQIRMFASEVYNTTFKTHGGHFEFYFG